jgi:hypothetical protein
MVKKALASGQSFSGYRGDDFVEIKRPIKEMINQKIHTNRGNNLANC